MPVFDWAFTLDQEKKGEPVGAWRRVDGREPSPGLPSLKERTHMDMRAGWSCLISYASLRASLAGQSAYVAKATITRGDMFHSALWDPSHFSVFATILLSPQHPTGTGTSSRSGTPVGTDH